MSSGRKLFEKLGSPKHVLAPMVDQSELAWRKLCREYGAGLCYSPMYHARLFSTTESYRNQNLSDLDGKDKDRPLIIQFCANNPDELVNAVQLVKTKCDAVDLNLGCPQGIARKGHYGSFLMEEWELVKSLVNAVHTRVPEIPITVKIRVFTDREKTLEYAKMLLDSGASWLAVHGRTRDMKGQNTGLADWSQIRYLRDNLPKETVIIANGNIIYRRDFERCLKETGADAVMTAETALANPAIFCPKPESEFQRVDKVLRKYLEIVKELDHHASKTAIKTHMFKLLRTFFIKETEIRNKLGPIRSSGLDDFEEIVKLVENRVAELEEDESSSTIVESDDGYFQVPYWYTQPLFRVVDGVASNGEVRKKRKVGTDSKAEEPKPQETKPQETRPQEPKPHETKPHETKPQETEPQESKIEEPRTQEGSE